MQHRTKLFSTILALFVFSAVFAQDEGVSNAEDVGDIDELKIAALEALINMRPEQALPRAKRVLESNNSHEVKESALFILSQIDSPEAQALLLDTARTSSGELQIEAIEMVGIGGDPESLAGLREVYESGDSEVREAVLESYLIADDSTAIYELAIASEVDSEEFESAVEMLGAMGASDRLRDLRDHVGVSESLIEAYAISGDYESLRVLSTDDSDPDKQVKAIEALGIVGGNEANTTLLEIYRSSDDEEVREAALEGMMIAGYSEGVLQLYRESKKLSEKKELLEYLTHMDSEDILEIIDSALEGKR